ncbi:peptidyl-tRNA hydrolase [Rhodococcus sp. WMMA185]|uniref:aminoacyl-tRNA hydrolase n=1 Tax=Rhodococcus sp. WMMA185 TaxID=679318 RepID=UPI000878E792|nr:aminoacyl-tRNA hydrolase [Rhodococcus sp. WMMA185]AOW92306.1 peptidyl-tRNA hydrolase [Rhodococcus sp. WMMA185]
MTESRCDAFPDGSGVDGQWEARHAVLAAGYGGRPDPNDPARILSMPIVLHIPKAEPPPRSALLEAAAAAVAALCLDPRVGVDEEGVPGPWHEDFLAWVSSRMRKVSRRARGAGWRAAQEVDGITVDSGGAQARVLVPGQVGALDPRIKKLQVEGTDFDHDDPGEIPDGVPVLWTNSALDMTVGKAAAQVGHASMLLLGAMSTERARRWATDGYRCAVRDADPRSWQALMLEVAQGRAIAVRDAGFTEVAPGSMTVIACP